MVDREAHKPTLAAPWERRRSESSKAFGAFAAYRDMGPQRSLERVRQNLGKKPSFIRQLQRWSSQHEWVTRCAAWDAEQDRVAREARLQRLRDGVPDMQERQVRSAERDQQALDVVATKLLERLERGDLDLLGQLDTMSAADLVKLAALAARARKIAVQVEWAARGVTPAALMQEAPEGDEAEERSLDQLLERIRGAREEEEDASP